MRSRYDKVYETLAARAVKQGGVDVETFMTRAAEAGMPQNVLEARLIQDVESGGPIFGKFLRSLKGAAVASTMAAEAQGEAAAQAYAEELISLAELEDVIDSADPDELADIVDELDDRELYIWICELVKTCDRCLPLHGTELTLADWEASGYDPATIHDGWESECHCVLMPASMSPESRKELVAPLVRERVQTETGLKGSKQTQRLVAQVDLDKATRAAEVAKQSLVGRRTLRLMGQVNQEGE